MVVRGEEVSNAATELAALHLTRESEHAEAEVALFFPDITEELMAPAASQEEPQTQIQIQQANEAKE